MKTYKIQYSQPALHDLKQIYAYIATALQAPDTAEKLIHRIRKEIHALQDFPARYPAVEWEPWRSRDMHRFSIGSYTVFYLIEQDAALVRIVRIFYGGRNPRAILSSLEDWSPD